MLPFQGSQRPFLVDMEQVRVSNASNVTVTPYALPVCMTQHHIPVCTGGGGAAPGVSVHAGGPQPTWSFPPCSVHIPACGMQHHLPACISHHQVPLAHAIAPPPPPPPHLVAPPPPPPPPPHFHHHHHHHQHHQHHHHQHHQHQSNPSLQHQTQQNHPQHHHQQQQNHPVVTSYQHQQQQHQQQQHQQQHHHQHHQQPSQPQHAPPQPPPSLPGAGSQHHHIVSQSHVTPATHFVSAMPTLHRVQDELMAEPRFPYLNIPHMATQQPSARHQPPPPPPILVHDHIVHAIPHEFFGTLSRYRRVSSTRQRWRTIHPPPPPYPGFLLHFLAMLGRPPLTQYRMSLHNLHEDGADLDNYEALLNLADRLGEAKPRGLTKCDIDLLPCYRFNQEIRRSLLDQTSCVICMCDFESRQLLRALPCCHEFHARCVDKWLKANRTCPICRADATERMKAESE